jgi:hypothetical protein
MNELLPEQELGELISELETIPVDELREAMVECFKEMALDYSEGGPLLPMMSSIDLQIKVWSKHTTDQNRELREASQHLVDVLQQLKREHGL